MHITANSNEVREGSIFFALKGAKFDGHDFIPNALARGASLVYAERAYDDPRVRVLGPSARQKLGELASEMHHYPSRELRMIGVTGTSGKTTTTYLIQHLLNSTGPDKGYRCARLGTNGGEFAGHAIETANTTPDALSLQRFFADMLRRGATHVAMEVSSHSLDQERAWGIEWDAAVFLNLSHEHLDYHPTLDAYFAAKERLFTDHAEFSRAHGKNPVLLTRADHEFGKRLLRHPGVRGYSVTGDIDAATIAIGGARVPYSCPLYGAFQLENILAAVRVAEAMGLSAAEITAGLASFAGVPGRMEEVPNTRGIRVFVDYAHKPEALEKVLLSIRGPHPVITVFGCGGDRDKTKRPVMGGIAARLSTRVIVTSDNPRTEDPLQILREVEAGMAGYSNYRVIPDRREAIRAAIGDARPGDIVLIAGKGHEDYQIIGTTKRHFDDRLEARAALEGREA